MLPSGNSEEKVEPNEKMSKKDPSGSECSNACNALFVLFILSAIDPLLSTRNIASQGFSSSAKLTSSFTPAVGTKEAMKQGGLDDGASFEGTSNRNRGDLSCRIGYTFNMKSMSLVARHLEVCLIGQSVLVGAANRTAADSLTPSGLDESEYSMNAFIVGRASDSSQSPFHGDVSSHEEAPLLFIGKTQKYLGVIYDRELVQFVQGYDKRSKLDDLRFLVRCFFFVL